MCLGGRASQPERPGRQAARYVSTLWSCDEPGLIWRKKWAAETHATVRRPATPNAPARAAGVVAIESIVFRKYDRAIHTTARVKRTHSSMTDKDWHRNLRRSHPLPGGGELRILRDAGHFMAKLPRHEHDAPAWRAAI